MKMPTMVLLFAIALATTSVPASGSKPSRYQQCLKEADASAKRKIRKHEGRRVACRWSCLGWGILNVVAGGLCLPGCEVGFNQNKGRIEREKEEERDGCRRFRELVLPYRARVRHILPEDRLIKAIGKSRIEKVSLSSLTGLMEYEEANANVRVNLSVGTGFSTKSSGSFKTIEASYSYAGRATLSPLKKTYLSISGERFRLVSVTVGRGFYLHMHISGRKAKTAVNAKYGITKLASMAMGKDLRIAINSELIARGAEKLRNSFVSIPELNTTSLMIYFKSFGKLQKPILSSKVKHGILAVTVLRQ